MTSRSYCFTINNPSVDEQLLIEETIPNETIRYIIYGLETGESGTPHLQGYMELNKPIRLAGLKKIEPFSRAHLETRRGTREQAREYCMKDNEWIELGQWDIGGQGCRTDLKGICKLIAKEVPLIDIMEANPTVVSRNLRFIEKYISLEEKKRTKEFRHVETEVLIGDAGIGKTKSVWDREPDVFTVNPEDTFPFDGYDGESAILIDDFEGQLKYKHLLKILDGYQLRVNVKGGHRYARWTKVYITTNEEPEGWYQRGLTPALARRLTTVTRMCNEEVGNTMPPLENLQVL